VAPYTYLWSNGQTDATISGLAAGTYTVTVTDANLCTDTESVTITQPAAAVLAAINDSTNVLCYGGLTGSATASASGGVAPYTYLWSNGQTDATISGLAAGTYTVTVTDANLCTDTESVTITQPENAFNITLTEKTDLLCYGDASGTINISVSGGTPTYTYNWSNGATTQDISELTAGTYKVIVTDANGCVDSLEVEIGQTASPLIVSLNYRDIIGCYGAATGYIDIDVTGGTPGYTYNWSNGATTQDIGSLTAGIYKVIVTDANGCVDSLEVEITQPASELIVSLINKVDNICYGDASGAINIQVLGGTRSYSFSWNNGATSQNISGLTAGIYTVTVTDEFGCIKTLDVEIEQPASPLTITINSKDTVNCYGEATGSVNIDVTGGTAAYSYLWSNGATSQDISNLIAGTYKVIVTDANGCVDSLEIEIGQPATPFTIEITEIISAECGIQNSGSATVSIVSEGSGNYSYLWDNGSTTSTASLSAGNHSVTVTDLASGCSDNITVVIPEEDTEAPVIICPMDIDTIITSEICEVELLIPIPQVNDNCTIDTVYNSFNNTNDASGIYPVGTTVVVWIVKDMAGNADTCEQLIVVKSIPLAVNDNITLLERTSIKVDPLENDIDCDNNIDPSAFTIIEQPEKGTVSEIDSTDGTFVYTPNAGFSGVDSILYRICDLDELCSEAWIYIVAVNNPPVAVNDNFEVENCDDNSITFNVMANDSDPDGDELTGPTIISNVASGNTHSKCKWYNYLQT
jgi:hypothetical protein